MNNVKIFWIFYTIIILLIAYGTIDRTEARNDNTIPPRIQQVCYDNFYGVGSDWMDKNPKFANRCKGLWKLWVEEEKNRFYF